MAGGRGDAARLLVCGDEGAWARRVVNERGLELVRRDPDAVLCHGGDGTLLRAERLLPGVPKIPVRVGRHAALCSEHTLEAVLDRFLAGTLAREELELLEVTVGRSRLHALNDVVLRNDNPAVAVRFRVGVDGEHSGEITGDGLVVATPFGSTGYYRSITRSHISDGLGVAFNNTTRPLEPLRLTGDAAVTVEVERGPAVLVADNDPRAIPLRSGHRFTVRLAERRAVVLGLDGLRCQRCRRDDDEAFNPH